MPELPEVQTVVDTLRPKAVGSRIAGVRLNRTDIVSPADINLSQLLLGRTIAAIDRRGKRIVFTLDTGERFYIHLGMSGRLGLHSASDVLKPHTHLILQLQPASRRETSVEMRFVDPRRFGGIWWLGRESSADEKMGPEPMKTRPDQLAKRLSRTTRAIKNALLDQTVLAGLGNIYVDESLFAAGIDPLSPANELTRQQIGRLSRSIKAVLNRALRFRGSTLRDYRDANGEPGRFQDVHRVYAREGEPCRNCKTPIERIVLGGRSTHFCPRCQPRRDRL